jgi:hypothetical protein
MDRLEHFFRHFEIKPLFSTNESPNRLVRIKDLVQRANICLDRFVQSSDYQYRPKKETTQDRAVKKVRYNADYMYAIGCVSLIMSLRRAIVIYNYIEY